MPSLESDSAFGADALELDLLGADSSLLDLFGAESSLPGLRGTPALFFLKRSNGLSSSDPDFRNDLLGLSGFPFFAP